MLLGFVVSERMEGNKKQVNPRGGGRTPQPPSAARDPTRSAAAGSSKPPTQPRSRQATPTTPSDSDSGAVASLAAAGVPGARSSVAPRMPKSVGSASNNNNTTSPRAIRSTRKPTGEEPATDDDDAADRFSEPAKDEWLRQSEVTLAALEKQVHDAAKRTLKHQHRCSTMKESIVGKEERMDTLRGTYATLNRALNDLELVSSGDLDSDALEEMYNSIPSDERPSALLQAAE